MINKYRNSMQSMKVLITYIFINPFILCMLFLYLFIIIQWSCYSDCTLLLMHSFHYLPSMSLRSTLSKSLLCASLSLTLSHAHSRSYLCLYCHTSTSTSSSLVSFLVTSLLPMCLHHSSSLA